MNIYLKKTAFCILLQFICLAGFSQSNFYKFSAGAGFGTTVAFADLDEQSFGYGGYAEVNFNFSLFMSAGIEFQFGQLKGGNVAINEHQRAFLNRYKAVSLNVKGALGQVVDYSKSNLLNALKGFYVGVGLGAIRNNLPYIERYKRNSEAAYPPLGYRFPGEDQSTDLLMPINLGVNFFINDKYGDVRYSLNLNYQTNLTFGEGLDGYNDPIGEFKNNAPDIYTFLSAGIKYNFGPSRTTKRHF